VRAIAIAFVLALASTARADAPKPIVGARVQGHSKLTNATALRLAHVELGDPVTPDQIPQLEAALMSSELFKSAHVTLEDAPNGVVMVATLDDKMSWIAAPTIYVLPSNQAVGVGYAENNLFGENKKLLLYGQLGNHTSMFFGTYLIPYARGTPLVLRFDLYLLDHDIDEYTNPASDPTDFSISRTSTEHFLDAGALVGWQFNWWFLVSGRLRGAYVYFNNVQGGPKPEADGRDVTLQAQVTADARRHLFGVTWGPFLQFTGEGSIPGLDTYGYQLFQLRAYYSWRLFGEHQLELRTYQNVGHHLPFHEELTNGGVSDLRGYEVDQFRGDVRSVYRVEYSVPLFHWSIFAFRALGFWDGAYDGFHFQNLDDGSRNYLPTQGPGSHWWRDDVGAGLRVYVKNVVLPLLGLDFGYGIEGHSPEIYFEVGLTDF
jgi:outer membrane protein assembly factor BamA